MSVDIKIKIGVDGSDDTKPVRRQGYPPIDDQPGAAPACTFKFYNLATEPDPENDGEWLDLDGIFETEKKTLGTLEYTFDSGRLNIYKHYGFEARQHTHEYTFISNTYEIPLEDIQAEFSSDNDDRWERRPIQLANTLIPNDRDTNTKEFEWYGEYPDDWVDGGAVNDDYDPPNYYFVGDGLHEIRIELLGTKDGDPKLDISRELYLKDDMTGRGVVKDGIEDEDGDINPLKYVWRNTKAGSFYLKCREVGNASIAHYVRVDNEEYSRWQIYEDMTQQGIFFYGFDTSDTGEDDSQFKITSECDPDADEVSGKIIRTLDRPDVEVYLMPRRIAYYARESGLDAAPTEFELTIGSGTRKIYRDDSEEFTPSEATNPCLHNVIQATSGAAWDEDHEYVYDGVTLIGSMNCSFGSFCNGVYYPIGGGYWYCYAFMHDCTGISDVYAASTELYATQLPCINYIDSCNADWPTSPITVDCTVKHKDATSRTHKHTIGLWYGQMPNKAFVYNDACCVDQVEQRSDLEDGETKEDKYNETHYMGYGGGYFPATVDGDGYTSYTIKNKYEPWSVCYDVKDTTDMILGEEYLYITDLMWYWCPNIPHFHDPLTFHTKNFIEDAGGTQEEMDDVVNPIRTFHFYTYDYDYSNHNIGQRGTSRDYVYESSCCPEACTVWWDYYSVNVAKECVWRSSFNFMIDYFPVISCYYRDTHDLLFLFPAKPHPNELGTEIFNKIQNSNVWSDYYDKEFGYEGRTYESKPYGFGIVPAKAGTLAAIVKVRSRVFYIWFKTDEDYKIWGRAKKLANAGSRTTDDYELSDYEGYQLGFEDANCDNLLFGFNDETLEPIGSPAPEQYWYEDGTSAVPTGFYNQCAGTGTREITHLGRTPVIEWSVDTEDDWVDGDEITDGAFIPSQQGPCRVPFHTGSTSNHFKRGTLKAPNEGEFELDAPVIVIGSRDYPVRDDGKNHRNCWCMNHSIGDLYFR